MSRKSDSINRQRIMDMKGHNEVLMRDIKKDRGTVKAKKVYSKEVLEKFNEPTKLIIFADRGDLVIK